MEVIRTTAGMHARAQEAGRRGQRIGLVPTMGYLHEGHLSLVRIARPRCDLLVVSIFVNPTQFGPGEDYQRYPRDFQRDQALCRRNAVDIVFYPPVEEMYAPNASVYVDEERLSKVLCGASRPGHFRGVLTVVAKLFNIVRPDLAVFGQKDAQQLRLIQQMVRDLNFPVEIVVGPIVREPDGLAMSSRNTYLSSEERLQALCLTRALQRSRELVRAGERDASRLRSEMIACIKEYPLARIDYVQIVDWETLQPVEMLERKSLAALAVWIGKTRLIDNAVLEPSAVSR